MYNPLTKQHIIIADQCLVDLNKHQELTLKEEDLANTLGSYNLRNGLETLGDLSRKAFFIEKGSSKSLGLGGYRDDSGVFVTQFALSYLCNILLISRANDWKKKLVSDKENSLLLLNMYSNLLVQPKLDEEKIKNEGDETIASMFVRMSFEQFEYQFEPDSMIARNMVMFTEILQKHQPKKFSELNTIFEKETSLSIKEYYMYGIFIFACLQDTSLFSETRMVGAKIEGFEDYFTIEKLDKFIGLVSADYKTIRELDKELNKNLDPINTKNRLNPLKIFPIIKTDKTERGFPYVVPNIINFLFKSFDGVYWWFDHYFQLQGKIEDYRTYFGSIFEDYVGLVLKDIYGESEVLPEISYKKGKFTDWVVEKNETVYLFEAKSYQFSLPTLQTGDIERIIGEVRKKIVQAIKQVYERSLDIEKYSELSHLRGKKIVPVIVFLDIPLVSSSAYKTLIKRELDILEQDDKYKGIANFNFNLLNIDELEQYAYASDIAPLEAIFDSIKGRFDKGFISEIYKLTNNTRPKKNFITKKYNQFFNEILVNKKSK